MRSVLVIDDDEVSRELLLLLLEEAGYSGTAVESGEEAIELIGAGQERPFAVLADMQMPGTRGGALARKLRALCGPKTKLVAMSGSRARDEDTVEFDGFLLKPFAIDELRAALRGEGGGNAASAGPAASDALDEETFSSLAHSIPREQLRKLYGMCLDDAERRIGVMRVASQRDDVEAWRRAAHAIKGGCGMVGARELAALAGAMEEEGLTGIGKVEALERFVGASTRLRRILDAKLA